MIWLLILLVCVVPLSIVLGGLVERQAHRDIERQSWQTAYVVYCADKAATSETDHALVTRLQSMPFTELAYWRTVGLVLHDYTADELTQRTANGRATNDPT